MEETDLPIEDLVDARIKIQVELNDTCIGNYLSIYFNDPSLIVSKKNFPLIQRDIEVKLQDYYHYS